MLRARVAMRLKATSRRPAPKLSSLQRRRDFVRMMTVIVEQRKRASAKALVPRRARGNAAMPRRCSLTEIPVDAKRNYRAQFDRFFPPANLWFKRASASALSPTGCGGKELSNCAA